jgi:hypothetical protein
MFISTRPHLPTEEGSGATTHPTASDHASPMRRAPALPHVLWLGIAPPHWGGIQHRHFPHEFLRVAGVKNNEWHGRPCHVAHVFPRCARDFPRHTHLTSAAVSINFCKACGQAAPLELARCADRWLQCNASLVDQSQTLLQ